MRSALPRQDGDTTDGEEVDGIGARRRLQALVEAKLDFCRRAARLRRDGYDGGGAQRVLGTTLLVLL
ncbi:MAG: hypothetical protein MJD61_21865 [Proteobacteria bacterium]|nr:hypothetical protein [Pseudomonadota bacterium]